MSLHSWQLTNYMPVLSCLAADTWKCLTAVFQNAVTVACYADSMAASVCPDWLAFELTQPMIDKVSSTTDRMVPSKATITRPELTLRCVLVSFFCLPVCSACVTMCMFEPVLVSLGRHGAITLVLT